MGLNGVVAPVFALADLRRHGLLIDYRGGVEESVMTGYMEDKKIVHLADIMRHRRADGFKNISGNWYPSSRLFFS